MILYLHRHGLSGQRLRIKAGASFYNHAVERHLFPWLNDDRITDFDFIRIDLLFFSIPDQVSILRVDIHQLGDGLSRLVDSIIAE